MIGSRFRSVSSVLRPLLVALAAVALVIGATAGLVAVLGDPSAATPRKVVSLRDGGPDEPTVAELDDVLLAPDALAADAIDPLADPALDPQADAAQAALLEKLDRAAAAPRGDAPARPLPRAPIPGFAQAGPMGPLPVIAADGRTPMEVYKRPFTGDASKPRLAVVIGGLGFNARVTQAAIDELPADITLSFVPYAEGLQQWIDKARADGHEVLIEIPMEPFDPEADDTGPQTLLAAAEPRENVSRLENLMSRAVGYFGVTNYQGGKFAASSTASAAVAKALKQRGLGLVVSGIGPRSALGVEAQRVELPFAAADRVLDLRREADAIDDQLLNLEALALDHGAALGAGFAYPVTIDQVRLWASEVGGRGYALAPASSVVEKLTAAR